MRFYMCTQCTTHILHCAYVCGNNDLIQISPHSLLFHIPYTLGWMTVCAYVCIHVNKDAVIYVVGISMYLHTSTHDIALKM